MNLGQNTYHCSICLIRENPVETLSGDTIAKVIDRGRPTPPLPLLAKECRYKGKIFTRRFKSENYLRYSWLSGCDMENKLYCWPCFVFSSDPSDTWGYKGFDGLSNFSNSVKTHMHQELHLLNVEKYNCYAPKEKAIVVQEIPAGQPGSRRRFEAAPEMVSPQVETIALDEEDDDDCDIIRQLDVLVEMIQPDDPREADSDARESCDMSQPSAAGAEKYQLKWHSHQQNLNSSISCLYRNDRYADVTLITCNNEENFTIPAHKLVLGTSSKYFANIFDKNIAPPHAMTYIVLPPELTRRAIQTLIQYMYTGESTVSADILNEVLRGGEILKIRGLWRNQGAGGSFEATAEQVVQKNTIGQHRTERVSVDRVPLQEPRVAQNPVHDSPVIVTNPVKSYGISQSAQMPASSSTPVINVKKDVAIDPGERCGRPDGQHEGHSSGTKRPLPQTVNQENSHQISRHQSTPKTSPSRSALTSAENVPTGSSMPEALNFLNVKEEPVEWTDVNADEIQLGKRELSMVKVEMKEPSSATDECENQNQEQIYSPLTCELCSETFTVPAEWVRHIESHTDPPHTVSKRRRRMEDNDDADATAALKCDLCAMYFVTPAEWVRHVQSTHTETELAMSNNSSTSSRRTMKTVAPTDTLQQHPIVTTSVAATTSQQQQQQQEKACPICNKSFPSYASMIIHKRTHTGERPFYCDICNKGFNVKSNLLRHMRTLHNQQGSQSPGGDPDSHGSD